LDLLIRTAQTEHLGETNQVLEDKVKRLDAELAEKDTLLKLQEAVGECNEILKADLDHAEKKYDELKAWVDQRESYVAELEREVAVRRTHGDSVEKENTQLAESLRRAAEIANAANARYHELFNYTQDMRSKNIAQEQELARLRGALMGIMQPMQPQACEVSEGGCDCDDCYEDGGEDCLGCESGVDCPQAHTCGETNTSGQWEVVNNES
jgi:chromosome segregation ATPase